jgi:hypothetical protein
MIMGPAEKYLREDNNGLSSFARISLTEECKLLPSSGIYAVSIEAGSGYSKGMVIIIKREENTSDVLVNIFDDIHLPPGHKISSFFHKKIHGAVNLTDSKSIQKINMAKEEILELIY